MARHRSGLELDAGTGRITHAPKGDMQVKACKVITQGSQLWNGVSSFMRMQCMHALFQAQEEAALQPPATASQ